MTSNQIGGTVFGSVVQAGYVDHVTVTVPSPRPLLSGLPADPAGFVGRERVLAELTALLDASGVIVVAGAPGVGKTALALRMAHELVRGGRFSGGVLFADLRGYDRTPADPAEILATFVRALALPDGQVPATRGELETTYRSLLAHRAADAGDALVLLDNASSSAQVRPLLPGSGAHRVVVTSRHWLGDLDVQPLSLGVLDAAESVTVLRAGDRLFREPDAAQEVATLCGHLPLALRIAAALLADDSTRPLSDLAEALRDRRHRLTELQYDDNLAVRAAFDLSYALLAPTERRMFSLLSLATGQLISELTARVLADTDERETRRLLAGPCRAHMVQRSDTRQWYRFHDLIRLYATEKVAQEIPTEVADAAVERMMVEFYEAARSYVAQPPSEPEAARRTVVECRDAASAWLNQDYLALVEAVELAHRTGRRHTAVRLGSDAYHYLFDTRRWPEAVRVLEAALESALELGDIEYEATLRCDLVKVLGFVGREQESGPHLMRALQIARELGHRRFEGVVLGHLGFMYSAQGNFTKAIEYHGDALEIATETGFVQEQASQHVLIGTALENSGNFDGAVVSYNRGIHLYRQIGKLISAAFALRMLGGLYLTRLNRYDLAFDHYIEAQQIYSDAGHWYDEADMWDMLGLTCLRAGDTRLARQGWQAALLLADRIGYQDLAEHVTRMLHDHALLTRSP